MCEPALEPGHSLKMGSQYNVNTYQEHWAIPKKNPSETDDRGGGDMEFPRILKNVEIPGSIKKEVEFPQESSQKTHVE